MPIIEVEPHKEENERAQTISIEVRFQEYPASNGSCQAVTRDAEIRMEIPDHSQTERPFS